MPTNSLGMHDCEARNQPRSDEWECPECGQTWLGSHVDIDGFLWETPEDRNTRIEKQEETEQRLGAPSPEELGLS